MTETQAATPEDDPTPEPQITEPPFPLPEVRQCQDPAHYLYGAVAVKGDGKWGVMHPVNGGHWSQDDEVADWTVLS